MHSVESGVSCHCSMSNEAQETGRKGCVVRKVLLIEDHGLIATTLSAALRSRGYDVAHCTTLTREDILRTAQDFAPEVILLDHDLGPQLGTSVSLIPELRSTGAKVVMLTATTSRARVAECVEAGAQGLLTKNEPLDGLVAAIEDVVDRGSLLTATQQEQLLAQLQQNRHEHQRRRAPFEQLTKREQEVLLALMKGQSAQEISEQTFTSIRTVRGHIQAVLDKLDVSSQLAAVAKAREAGWPSRHARLERLD